MPAIAVMAVWPNWGLLHAGSRSAAVAGLARLAGGVRHSGWGVTAWPGAPADGGQEEEF